MGNNNGWISKKDYNATLKKYSESLNDELKKHEREIDEQRIADAEKKDIDNVGDYLLFRNRDKYMVASEQLRLVTIVLEKLRKLDEADFIEKWVLLEDIAELEDEVKWLSKIVSVYSNFIPPKDYKRLKEKKIIE